MRPDDTDDGLAYGTEDGYLCIWRRNEGAVSGVPTMYDDDRETHLIHSFPKFTVIA